MKTHPRKRFAPSERALSVLILSSLLCAQLSAPAYAQGGGEGPARDEAPQTSVAPPAAANPVDLNRVHGIASRDSEGTFTLASILPDYKIPPEIENAAMAGTATLAEAGQYVTSSKMSPGFKAGLGVTRKAAVVVNLAVAAMEASKVGLDEGHENMNAELYLLHKESEKYKACVERAKNKEGGPDESDRAEMRRLRLEFGKLEQDFDDHSTPWSFFHKAVLTEASGATLVREAGVFLNESFGAALIANLLGSAGNLIGLKRARSWTWSGTRAGVRWAVNSKLWRRWRLSQRLLGVGRVTKDYTTNLAGEWGKGFVGTIVLGKSPTLDERISLVSQRLETVAPVPTRIEVKIVASNAFQAAAVIQNLALVPSPRAFATAGRPAAVTVTVVPPAGDARALTPWPSAADTTSGGYAAPPTQSYDSGPAAAAAAQEYVVEPTHSTLHDADSFAYRQAQYVNINATKFDTP